MRASAALALAIVSLVAATAWACLAAVQPYPDVSALNARVSTLAAAMPPPCPAVPAPDTLLGTLGAASPCASRADASRPTVVQAANVVTDANGLWSVAWAKPFVSAAPTVNPLPVNAGALPIMCNVQIRSASSASGKCWQANTNTLPGTLTALGGLVLNVFATGAANAPVMVIARDVTQ